MTMPKASDFPPDIYSGGRAFNAIYESGLSANQKLILSVIAAHMDFRKDVLDASWAMGVQELVRNTSLCERTIRYELKFLAAENYLFKEETKLPDGRKGWSKFTIAPRIFVEFSNQPPTTKKKRGGAPHAPIGAPHAPIGAPHAGHTTTQTATQKNSELIELIGEPEKCGYVENRQPTEIKSVPTRRNAEGPEGRLTLVEKFPVTTSVQLTSSPPPEGAVSEYEDTSMTYLMPADDRERFVELKRKNLPFDEQDMKLAMIWCDHTRRNAVRQHPSLELWAMMIAECRLEMGWNSETMAMLFEFARSNPTHFLFDLTVTPKLLMSTWKNGMTLAENLKSQFIQSKKGKEMLTRHQIRNIDYSKPI